MLRQYFESFVTAPPKKTGLFRSSRQITIAGEGVDDDLFASIAKRTDGFSGREITKLAIAWQAAAYGTQSCTLTREAMEEVLDLRIEQNMKKLVWQK